MDLENRGGLLIILVLLVIVGIFVFTGLTLRHAKQHCIPNHGAYNHFKVWAAGEAGIDGVVCQD